MSETPPNTSEEDSGKQTEHNEETGKVENSESAIDKIASGQHLNPLEETNENDPEQYDLPYFLARRWMATRHGSRWSDGTVSTYQSHIKIFFKFLEMNETSLLCADFNDLLQFIEYRVRFGIAESTVRRDCNVIHDLYKFIKLRTDAEPTLDPYMFGELKLDGLRYKGGFDREAIKPEEVQLLFDNFNHVRNRLMAYLAVGTGVRNSDIRALRYSEVDFDALEVKIPEPKNDDGYDVPISPELANKLKRWKECGARDSYPTSRTSDYMFPSCRGEKLESNEHFNRLVKRAAERAGIQEIIGKRVVTDAQNLKKNQEQKIHRVTPHTLRHTYLTLLKRVGVPPEARRLMANHKNIKTTKRYEHYDKEWHDLVRSLLPF